LPVCAEAGYNPPMTESLPTVADVEVAARVLASVAVRTR